MTPGQARALDLTETLPLLAAGILGMVAAAIGLALLAGPALNLAAFAAGPGGRAIRLGAVQPALALPAAGAVVAALVIVGAQTARATRRTASCRGGARGGKLVPCPQSTT